MPQNPCVIATKTPSSDVLIFDYTKHPSVPQPGAQCNPQLTLLGHKKEGYGLAWSPVSRGRLISGSDDGIVCYWNVESMDAGSATLDATKKFTEHTGVVEDVAWHPVQAEVFASVSDDKRLMIWDLRSGGKPIQAIQAHDAEINGLSLNPFKEFIVATCSSDKVRA